MWIKEIGIKGTGEKLLKLSVIAFIFLYFIFFINRKFYTWCKIENTSRGTQFFSSEATKLSAIL